MPAQAHPVVSSRPSLSDSGTMLRGSSEPLMTYRKMAIRVPTTHRLPDKCGMLTA
jgi:hypothetical protein